MKEEYILLPGRRNLISSLPSPCYTPPFGMASSVNVKNARNTLIQHRCTSSASFHIHELPLNEIDNFRNPSNPSSLTAIMSDLSSFRFHELTFSNFEVWSKRAKAILILKGLWEYVDPRDFEKMAKERMENKIYTRIDGQDKGEDEAWAMLTLMMSSEVMEDFFESYGQDSFEDLFANQLWCWLESLLCRRLLANRIWPWVNRAIHGSCKGARGVWGLGGGGRVGVRTRLDWIRRRHWQMCCEWAELLGGVSLLLKAALSKLFSNRLFLSPHILSSDPSKTD